MGKKIGICSICLKEEILSDDHVPPKCCGNNKDSYYRRFTPEYLAESPKFVPIHSQNGVKLRTICNKCNNDLGAIYDVELEKFYKSSLAQLNKEKAFYPFNLLKVVKAVIGHFLASAKPQNIPQDNDMRNFYNSDDEKTIKAFSQKYSLLCIGYPYKGSIFILRNYVTVYLKTSQKQITDLLSSLYFYPFAFIFTKKCLHPYGTDLLNFLLSNNKQLLSISLTDWYETDGNLLSPTWPAVADNSHFFIITPAAKESAFKPK